MEKHMPQVNAELTTELSDQELEKVTAGRGKSAAKNDPLPTEAISLDYGGIIYSYNPQFSDS
jgi:hypothetical protein